MTSQDVAPKSSEKDRAFNTDEWIEKYNEKYQRKYWLNTATGEKTWKNPMKLAAAAATAEAPKLPPPGVYTINLLAG